MADLELTWKRDADSGTYRARLTDEHGAAWVYQVGRDEKRHVRDVDTWYCAAWPADAEPSPVVRRTGFSGMKLAKYNATATRCSYCHRYRPLHVLHQSGTTGRRDVYPLFRCLDRAECDALVAKREAEEYAELFHHDHTSITVTSTEFGPTLHFSEEALRGMHTNSIDVTDADLAKMHELTRPYAVPADLLTWESSHGAIRGRAGDVELFSITWHSVRTDPNWLMSSHLTGVYAHWKDDDQDVLKTTAEEVLRGWLARIGGLAGSDAERTE